MSGPSSIEWTQATWNPVTGCTEISSGCDHCYARTFAERWRGVPGHPYEQGFDLKLWPGRLNIPRGWRKPRVIFVNSMSDLFHAQVPYEFVAGVWATMAEAQQHTFQVLTKRPDRMARFVARLVERFGVLPNVWLGTSIESQEYIERARHLLQAPAAVRFLSCEPLLGPLDLSSVLCDCGHLDDVDATPIRDQGKLWRCVECGAVHGQERPYGTRSIHWAIVGGESGPGARPCDPEWVRDIVRQCGAASVAPFVKQLGRVWAQGHACFHGGKHDLKGGVMIGWPEDLRVREMPRALEAIGA